MEDQRFFQTTSTRTHLLQSRSLKAQNQLIKLFQPQSSPPPFPITRYALQLLRFKKRQEKILPLIPWDHDTMQPRYHDTMIPLTAEDILEVVRKAVKNIGKEAATHRFTLDEKNYLADIEYTYKRQGIKTSENEITRIAINYFVEDYKKNGEKSILAKILKRLNS